MPPKKKTKDEFSASSVLLKKHIPENGKIILGLSGGADSVFLLNLCLHLQKTHPFAIIVAHVNHGIRGKESDQDATFAKNLAKKNALSFQLKKINKQPAGNTEEQFRKIRYDFFEKLRKKHKANLILTAHHLNDNIETVLLNLTRGCHLDGLKGMEIIDPKRHLLRPLLTTPKSEILKYLKKHRVPHREDSTNQNTDYSRNRIRQNVIPELKKINKNLEKSFLQNITNFKSVRENTDRHLDEWINSNSDKHGLKITSFIDKDQTFQKNIIFHLYKKNYGNLNGLSQNHADQIINIVSQNRAGRHKEFGPDCLLTIFRPKIGKNKYIRILKKKSKQVQ